MIRWLWLLMVLVAVPVWANPSPEVVAGRETAGYASHLTAQSSQLEPLAADALLQRILTQNPSLLAAQEAIESAKADRKSIEAQLWPSLSLNGQFTAGSTQRMSMPVPGLEPPNMSMRPPGVSANLNATAMYPLFTGGKLQAQVEGANERLKQAEATYKTLYLELRAEALAALLTLRWQQAQAEFLQAEIERQQAEVDLIQRRFELGKEAHYVLLRAKSEWAKLQQAYNLVKLEQAQQQVELRRMAALAPDVPLAEFPPLVTPRIKTLPTAQEALKLAFKYSPQLTALQAQLAEAETRVTIAQSSYRPFIYLVGVYEQRLPDRSEMSYTSGGAIDLLITLPVFDGFRRDAEVERLQREARRLLNQYTDGQNRLQATLTKQLLELETARQNLELGATALEQLSEESQIAHLRYSGGKAIQLEVFEVGNQYRLAQLNQLENAYRYEKARIQFEQLVGID